MMQIETDQLSCLKTPFIQKSVFSIRIKQELLNSIMRIFQY